MQYYKNREPWIRHWGTPLILSMKSNGGIYNFHIMRKIFNSVFVIDIRKAVLSSRRTKIGHYLGTAPTRWPLMTVDRTVLVFFFKKTKQKQTKFEFLSELISSGSHPVQAQV